MNTPIVCPTCDTVWQENITCETYFHQMLFWENEYPEHTLEVHHLLVLAYYLQHPYLYSREGLEVAKQLLVDFVEKALTPQEILKRDRAIRDSGNRKHNIGATEDSKGEYPRPVTWSVTAKDVTEGAIEDYKANVRLWARSILESLKQSGNL